MMRQAKIDIAMMIAMAGIEIFSEYILVDGRVESNQVTILRSSVWELG